MPERFIHSSHERDVSTKYQTGSEYPTSDQFQMSHSFTSALRGEAGHDPGWFHLGFVWDMCSGTHWVPTRINLVNLGLRIVLWPQRTCPSHKRWSWLSFPTADMGLETQQVEREDLKPGSTSEVIKFWQVGQVGWLKTQIFCQTYCPKICLGLPNILYKIHQLHQRSPHRVLVQNGSLGTSWLSPAYFLASSWSLVQKV